LAKLNSTSYGTKDPGARFHEMKNYEVRSKGGVQRRQMELKGAQGGDRKRGVDEDMRQEKSLRNGVHHAEGDVWAPV
jgi:hypothetical protein